LCVAVLGMRQDLHVLGPLANCHWSELVLETHGDPAPAHPAWRLRAHNVGAPGPVLPVAVRPDSADDASDAEA
jgi:glucosyl-3-phosphoglycerate phosphatase